MDRVEEDLWNSVGVCLHELSWSNCYQIHPFVALNSFFEAFETHGLEVRLNDKTKTASFTLNYSGRKIETKKTYEKILEGWGGGFPKSSPTSIYNSIFQIYNDFAKPLLLNSGDLDKIREVYSYKLHEAREVRRKMEKIWLPFFKEYHENMLVSVGGRIPRLTSPKLFGKVMEKFPMNVYRNACRNALSSEYGPGGGPTEDALLDFTSLDFVESLNPNEYYPSKATMQEFFLGHYLNKLSNQKGYPLKYKEQSKLKSLVIGGERSLEDGARINWGFKSLENIEY